MQATKESQQSHQNNDKQQQTTASPGHILGRHGAGHQLAHSAGSAHKGGCTKHTTQQRQGGGAGCSEANLGQGAPASHGLLNNTNHKAHHGQAAAPLLGKGAEAKEALVCWQADAVCELQGWKRAGIGSSRKQEGCESW